MSHLQPLGQFSRQLLRRSLRVKAIGIVTLIALLATAINVLALPVTSPTGSPVSAPAQQDTVGGAYIQSHHVTVNIDNQVAVTKIEQVFVNDGSRPAEGTYLFPLPVGAAVSNLTMFINGVPVTAQILDAQQAQQIYTNTVRQLRDPALLQYVGRSAIQANVFPIPAGDQRKIEITYSQIVTADNGLINYTYPLRTDYASPLPVREVSVSVDIASKDPISTLYSPNPLVVTSRTDDTHVKAGFETTNYRATDDFSLYYGVANADINANLLTYRGSANEDGYFMLMVTPPTTVDAKRIIPKDVMVVLDQSGSMEGAKWTQAQNAVSFVLQHLNPQDRFNVIVFSTGYRLYAKTLQPVSEASKAADWVNGLDAEGGTDINAALTTAETMLDPERQTTLLFLTDGLPTEGVTDIKQILDNVQQKSTPNMRLFAFGVGDDVDTYLLDSLSSTYHGTSVYVRPKDDIEAQVSSLYNKITSPVMTNLKLDVNGVTVDDAYPADPLPDLFAGSQLVIVGRYRDSGTATITLTGQMDGKSQTYTYSNLQFPDNAGGQPFIPRLWATRKIGVLLNQIRLSGASQELIDSVVSLSIRYGIITPYTSYLIQEGDIANQTGDQQGGGQVGQPAPIVPGVIKKDVGLSGAVGGRGGGGGAGGGGGGGVISDIASNAPTSSSGSAAVDAAQQSNGYANANSVAALPTATAGPADKTADLDGSDGVGTGRSNEPIKQIDDRTFVLKNGIWMDTLYTSDKMKVTPIIFLSDDYFKLLTDHSEIKDYLAIGDHVVIVIGDTAYEIKPQ